MANIRRGTNCLPSHTGFIGRLDKPKSPPGALIIGVNAVPPIPPSEEIVNVAPVISAGFNLPARLCRQLTHFIGDLVIWPSDQRSSQQAPPNRSVYHKADVCSTASRSDFSPVASKEELGWEFFNAETLALITKANMVNFNIRLRKCCIRRFTEFFQIADISFIELRHMRNHDPIAMQIWAIEFFDT